MIKETEISLKGVDPLLFYGSNDSNIKVLEKHFDSSIVARGNVLKMKGEEKELERIRSIVTEMVLALNRSGKLFANDVEAILTLEKAGETRADGVELDQVIVFTKGGFVKPRGVGQLAFYKSTLKNDIVFAIGPAGTGKTYVAVAIALAALKNKDMSKIILTRPAVEAGEKLGFLPGDLREKIEPYLAPLYDALDEMMPADKLRSLMERRVIEIIPLAYMRGRTLNNAFVILDEAQNATPLQMKMFLTRLGVNSRAIVTGDVTQVDLQDNQKSGLIRIQNVLKGIEGIDFCYFTSRDVARHKLVKEIIEAYERYSSNKPEDASGGG